MPPQTRSVALHQSSNSRTSSRAVSFSTDVNATRPPIEKWSHGAQVRPSFAVMPPMPLLSESPSDESPS